MHHSRLSRNRDEQNGKRNRDPLMIVNGAAKRIKKQSSHLRLLLSRSCFKKFVYFKLKHDRIGFAVRTGVFGAAVKNAPHPKMVPIAFGELLKELCAWDLILFFEILKNQTTQKEFESC